MFLYASKRTQNPLFPVERDATGLSVVIDSNDCRSDCASTR
jgi:hypothetical protein